jgi:hypothetical protein
MRELAEARLAWARLRRAATVATWDGWSVATFGALTFICSLFGIWGMALGAALTVIGIVELRALSALRRLQPAAPRMLSLNQLALGSLIILYAAWNLFNGSAELREALTSDPMVAQLMVPYNHLIQSLSKGVYVTLIGVAVFMQGGLALYYHRREADLRQYLQRTPAWIVQMQRSGVSV